MPFTFSETKLGGVVLVTAQQFPDERGLFAEVFKASAFDEHGITEPFSQFNLSKSKKDVLRGLHYQLEPQAQGKLVAPVSGRVFDVVVDLRRKSKTFKRWLGLTLSADKQEMVYVPPGYAHGFLTLSEQAEVLYYCTDEYAPELERGIIWNDSELAIDWPIQLPQLSEKDTEYPTLAQAEYNFS